MTSPPGLTFLDRQLKLNTAQDADEMGREIESCPNLTFLELRGNTIGIEAGERIGTALKKHRELKKALWSDLFTGRLKTEIPPILRSLCSSVMASGAMLTELDLSDNAFGPIGAEGIQDFLSSPSAFELRALRLNNNGLGAGGIIVAKSLLECHEKAKIQGRKLALRTFVAGRNRLEDPGAKALAKAFTAIGTLEEIVIPQNGIRADGVIALAAAFGANPKLRVININDNTCTRKGAFRIAMVLADLIHLEVLDLGDCLCRKKGTHAILAVLCSNSFTALKEVNFSGNELPADLLRTILPIWADRYRTATLRLSNNGFGGEFVSLGELAAKLKLNDVDFGGESDDEGTIGSEEESEEEEESDEEKNSESDGMEEEEDEEEECLAGGDTLASAMGGLGVADAPVPVPVPVSSVSGLSYLDRQLKLNTAQDADEMGREIESCPNLTFLELRGNTIGIKAGERIGTALKKHRELKKALWSDLFTGRLKTEIPPILRSLCSSVMASGAMLTELDLSDNAFGPIGAEGIQDFLSSPSAFELRALRLNNNGLGAGGIIVAKSLLECHEKAKIQGRKLALRTFVAGRNRLEDPGAKALAKAFTAIGTLEEIVIPQNGIRTDGVIALAAAFGANPKLRVININDNTCARKGALQISKVVGCLAHLEVLDLGDCLCRKKGTHAILAVLCSNSFTALKEVNFSGNELPADLLRTILPIWADRYRTATLRLSNNGFGGEFVSLGELATKLKLNDVDFGGESDDEGTIGSEEESEEEEEESDEEKNSDYDEEEEDEVGEEEEFDDEDEEVDVEKENSMMSLPPPMGQSPSSSLSRAANQNATIASFVADPTSAGLRSLTMCHPDDIRAQLKEMAQCREQAESARVLLSIAIVIGEFPMDFSFGVRIAHLVVEAAEAVPRFPIATGVQIVNHLVAHVEPSINRERDLVDTSRLKKDAVGKLLRELLSSGLLTKAKVSIDHYFKHKISFSMAPVTQPGVPQFRFNAK